MLNKRALLAVQRLLSSGKDRVAAGPVWQEIAQGFDLGTHLGSQIVFTKTDLKNLRAIVNEQVPGDIRHADLDGNRTNVSREQVNEKNASLGVFDHMVWGARSGSGMIPLTSGVGVSPPAAFLVFDYRELQLRDGDALIVVENGEALRFRERYIMPELLSSAVWVYRGHTNSQRYVQAMVAHHVAKRPVVGFFDFDPKGFCLALDSGVNHILLPRGWNAPRAEHPAGKRFNKHEEAAAQRGDLLKRVPRLSGVAAQIANCILGEGWALMQEHMAAHNVGLELVDLRK